MPTLRKSFNPLRLVPYVLLSIFFVGTGIGQITWHRTYGGAGYEKGYCVDQTTDGGYIVVGFTDSFGDGFQVYLVKTDSLGDTLWTKTYGSTGVEAGYSVQQTADEGYIITGFTTSFGNDDQIYLIKTDSLGDTLWTKTYGGPNPERGYSVKQTTDGDYIIVGAYGTLYRQGDFYLIKTDSLGDSLWIKTYDGRGYSVQQTLDGGYIIAGEINNEVYLVKTDSLGDTLWTRSYWLSADVAEGYSVQQTTDGGYIVAGYYWYVLSYNTDFYLIKTDSLGDTLWTRGYGVVPGQGYEEGHSVQQTQDGGYIVAGFTDAVWPGSVYLVKTDSLGDTLWTRTYGQTTYGSQGYSVQQTTDGGYIVAGYASGNGGDVYLVKTDEYGNVAGIEENSLVRHLFHTSQPTVCPNPFVSFTSVIGYEKGRFILYDISGRQVGNYFGNRIGFGLPAGVYFFIPEDKSFKPVRMVKVR